MEMHVDSLPANVNRKDIASGKDNEVDTRLRSLDRFSFEFKPFEQHSPLYYRSLFSNNVILQGGRGWIPRLRLVLPFLE
jgi:hypothetical protein